MAFFESGCRLGCLGSRLLLESVLESRPLDLSLEYIRWNSPTFESGLRNDRTSVGRRDGAERRHGVRDPGATLQPAPGARRARPRPRRHRLLSLRHGYGHAHLLRHPRPQAGPLPLRRLRRHPRRHHRPRTRPTHKTRRRLSLSKLSLSLSRSGQNFPHSAKTEKLLSSQRSRRSMSRPSADDSQPDPRLLSTLSLSLEDSSVCVCVQVVQGEGFDGAGAQPVPLHGQAGGAATGDAGLDPGGRDPAHHDPLRVTLAAFIIIFFFLLFLFLLFFFFLSFSFLALWVIKRPIL